MEILGYLVAIAVCHLMSDLVGKFLDEASSKINLNAPEGVEEEKWEGFVNPSGKDEGGKWLGTFERILAFFAFYVGAEIIVGGWLVFKVGSKWQIWSNVIKIPEKIDDVDDFSYLCARQRWGSWLLMRFLTGTLANLLIGFVLAIILKQIVG